FYWLGAARAGVAGGRVVLGRIPGVTAPGNAPDRATEPRAPGARPAPLLRGHALALAPEPGAAPLFEGLEFELRPGERLALAGPSGCGKSLLLEAIAGWVAPLEGRIAIAGGVRCGHAGQRPWLFQDSLAGNLRLAAAQDAGDLHAAAEAAQVLRFARQLPRGLDT